MFAITVSLNSTIEVRDPEPRNEVPPIFTGTIREAGYQLLSGTYQALVQLPDDCDLDCDVFVTFTVSHLIGPMTAAEIDSVQIVGD